MEAIMEAIMEVITEIVPMNGTTINGQKIGLRIAQMAIIAGILLGMKSGVLTQCQAQAQLAQLLLLNL